MLAERLFWVFTSNLRIFLKFTIPIIFAGYFNVALAADPVNGGQIYQSHCANCHGVNGQSDIPGTPNFSLGEGLFQSNRDLQETIENGKGVMPGYRALLKESEVFDVIAYLRTLR